MGKQCMIFVQQRGRACLIEGANFLRIRVYKALFSFFFFCLLCFKDLFLIALHPTLLYLRHVLDYIHKSALDEIP